MINEQAEMRWRNGGNRWVSPPEVFRPHRYRVERITETEAKDYVVRTHYAGSMPAARARYGLIHQPAFGPARLVGAVVYGIPMQAAALRRWCGVDHQRGVELSRLVLDDSVAFNGESFLVAAAEKLLVKDLPQIEAVLSYCDPTARTDVDGREVKRGHEGTVYKALGFRHVGRSSPRILTLDECGRVLSDRSVSKFRNGERGADYALRQIELASGVTHTPGLTPADYLALALRSPKLRRVPHRGNYVYVRSTRRGREAIEVESRFPPALPYVRLRPAPTPPVAAAA